MLYAGGWRLVGTLGAVVSEGSEFQALRHGGLPLALGASVHRTPGHLFNHAGAGPHSIMSGQVHLETWLRTAGLIRSTEAGTLRGLQ